MRANVCAIGCCLLLAWAGPLLRSHGQTPPPELSMTDPRVHLLGRYATETGQQLRLGYPGSGFVARIRGTSLGLHVSSSSASSALTVVVDHGEPALLLLRQGEQTVSLLEHAPTGRHTVEVYKRTETWQGLVDLRGLTLGPGDELLQAPPLPTRRLLFVGDSVTCGAGVDNNEQCKDDPARPNGDPYHSYGMVLGRRLDAQTDLVCYGGRGLERDYRGLTIRDGVVNAPDFLDLAIATDDPATRVSWNPHTAIPDGVVISLGTNDFNLQKTRPLDGRAFVAEYVTLLRRVRAEYSQATIFVTEGAIVTDPLLRQYVREAVAQTHDPRVRWAEATHYPGNGCNVHPTRAQHEEMANDLEPLLRDGLHW